MRPTSSQAASVRHDWGRHTRSSSAASTRANIINWSILLREQPFVGCRGDWSAYPLDKECQPARSCWLSTASNVAGASRHCLHWWELSIFHIFVTSTVCSLLYHSRWMNSTQFLVIDFAKCLFSSIVLRPVSLLPPSSPSLHPQLCVYDLTNKRVCATGKIQQQKTWFKGLVDGDSRDM